MLYAKYIALAAILLQAGMALAQEGQEFAADQPSSAYTIYNGKVYMHPKKDEGFFANLFKFDFYKNPVVQTVLGWSDAWYGTHANETAEVVTADPLATQGSYNVPQIAPSPYNTQYPQYTGKYPNSNNNYNNPANNYGKQPNYYPQGQVYPPKYGNQQPQYPQQNYNLPQANPQIPPYLNPSNFQYYGNPNVDIVNSLEAHGSMDNMLTQGQDRNYQASHMGNSEPPKTPKMVSEQPEATDRQGSAVDTKKVAEDKADATEDHYQCPPLGQWKWNGEYCIAIGPTPTWACKPTDMIMTGRVAVCRNKIFFPNET